MIIFWIVVLAAALLIEIASAALISIWFVAGAAAALIAAAAGAPTIVQVLLFVLFSAILLIFTRPLLKKLFPNKFTPTNSELSVGKSAVVIEEIDNEHGRGRVRLNGVDWIAVSDSEEVIPVDSVVTVLEVKGAKLLVKTAAQNTNETN
ncbi:MAG: NfeD family protein [Oscillospiraceae bacterium]|nr:NfeD family protein [Oscillospiraceae bacterium]